MPTDAQNIATARAALCGAATGYPNTMLDILGRACDDLRALCTEHGLAIPGSPSSGASGPYYAVTKPSDDVAQQSASRWPRAGANHNVRDLALYAEKLADFLRDNLPLETEEPPEEPEPVELTLQPMQPAGFAYNDASTAGVSAYAHPGGLVVAGRTNYAAQAFKDVSAAGGHVLIYLDALVIQNHGLYHSLLFDASQYGAAVPRFPGNPSNPWGYFSDFRPGSLLLTKLEAVLERVVADNPHMAGFFADDLGTRHWSDGWDSMSAARKLEWYNGAVAVAQVYRTVCDRHGLIFVVNGTWDPSANGGYPDKNAQGCSLADGICAELHDYAGATDYWGPVAQAPQWATESAVTEGEPVHIAINATAASRASYGATGAFAYSAQQVDYGNPPAPWGAFHATGLPTQVN